MSGIRPRVGKSGFSSGRATSHSSVLILHGLITFTTIPFTTAWLGQNHFAATPAAGYGIVLLTAALAYYGLQTAIIRDQGSQSVVATAVGRDVKGKLSPVLYAAGIGLSFVSRWPAVAIYASVALMWNLPPPMSVASPVTSSFGIAVP